MSKNTEKNRESWSQYSGTLEKSKEYHNRYHIAVSSPVRRKILKLIAEGRSEEEILEILKLSKKQLDYHLEILEWGFCIHREGNRWVVTKEGEIIHYLEK
jgi:predicted transcriptional regulator